MKVIRDYTDDEIDADLRHLGINRPANLSRHAKINLILNYYTPDQSKGTLRRAQENLEMLRRGNIERSSEAVIQEMAANTGMEVENIKRLFA